MCRTTLYKIDVSGKARTWTVEIVDNTLVIQHGILGGAIQTKTETITKGLATRTLEEQVKSRYYSRINQQYDRGYKDSLEHAKSSVGTNGLGLVKPMLAQPINKVKSISFENAFVQHKYDGHRCMITKQNGDLVAYSRQDKIIESIGHILEELDLVDGDVIDGELYCHGASLQTISSWIKREQSASRNLMFHAYDLVIDRPFKERFERLNSKIVNNMNSFVVPTTAVGTPDMLTQQFHTSRKEGYEGSILRWGDTGYEVGKRSKSLVKIKQFFDDEFKVIDIHQSKDGWAIAECLLPNGDTFRVTAPGGYDEKYDVWKNRNEYLGQYLTVEYANLTPDQKPFHPVGVRWREDV